MLVKKFKYLSKEETVILLNSVSNAKHKVLVLLMLDAGLRVSEAISIKFKNLDFKNRTLTIESAKQRDKKELRTIPMSGRLYLAFAEYLKIIKFDLSADGYCFPSGDSHTSRQSIWKVLKKVKERKNLINLHPHALRHTFATHHLAAGSKLEEIKTMLGHKSYNTTLIYADIPTETLKERVNAVTAQPKPFYLRLAHRLKPPAPTKKINLDFSENYYTIGRNDDLKQLNANIERGINTIIVGPIGCGKSHLLENITTTKQILRLDDTESIKKSLANILLFLYTDKKSALYALWQDFTPEQMRVKIQRETVIQICDTIIASVVPRQYILLIDNITRITPSGKKAIERMKDAFIIICAARQVKAKDTSFLWNFEKFAIRNLPRKYSLQLINQHASSLEVENMELLRNHIFNQTDGNPRAIIELIDRYKKEPFLDIGTIREIKHIGALQEFDLTFIILLFLGVLMSARYMSRELDEPALKFIGSLAMVVLLFMRPMMRNLKRQFM